MHLKKIELQGFKSFADKTTIELKEGITSIVRPNGSGKSNISDAIRWTLGEQSMKTLRGEKSQDLVFAGTQSRKSLGFAQCSLIFDNTDGVLPIEYSEVKITRRIYKSGEGQVYINDNPVRLKDVTELFLDTGIGKDGYSIIGQGRVEQIISSKSEDRRNIFEEAAGIVKYRYRKEESEKKLEKAKINLLRINDIIDEISNQLEPLKAKASKAKKYLELKERVKLLDTNIIKITLDKLKKELNNLIDFSNSNKENIITLTDNISNLKIYIKDLKQKIDQLQNTIDELNSSNFDTKSKIEKLNSNILVNNTTKENIQKTIEDIKEQIKNLNEQIEKNNIEIEQKEEKSKIYIQNKEKYEKEYEIKQKQYNEQYEKLSSSKKEKQELKQKQEELKDELYEINIELNNEISNKEKILENIKIYNNQITENKASKERIQINNEENLNKVKQVTTKKQEIENKISALQLQKGEIEKQIDINKQNLQNKENEKIKDNASLKLLEESEKENDGYQRSVKYLLENKKVINTVAKSFNIKDEYVNAIDIALGNKIQNIIVENKENAKELINLLKENKIGRATFLPKDDLKIAKLDLSKISLEKGYISTADKLVSVDSSLENVAKYLLGTFVIVDTLENGLEISKKYPHFKLITLDGDFISPDGSLSGRYKLKNSNSILNRQNRIENLKQKIKEQEQEIEQSIEENKKEEEKLSIIVNQIFELEKDKNEVNINYVQLHEQNKYVLLEIEKIQNQIEKLQKQITDKQKLLEKNNEKEKALYEKKKEKTQELHVIEEKLNAFSNEIYDNSLDILKDDITNLKISLSSITESYQTSYEIINRIKSENELYAKKIKQLCSQENNYQKDIKNLENKNKEIEKSIVEIEKANTKYNKDILELRQQKEVTTNKINENEQKLLELQNNIEILKENSLKNDNKIYKINEQINSLMQRLWEDYELTPNNIENIIEIENIAKAQKEVIDKKEEIKLLGDIDISSIEEYKEQSKRYDYLSTQKQDLDSTISTLNNVISQITKTMKVQFADKFKQINKNFSQTFSELFGGGNAYLELEDETHILECGIEIKAQPPGKKLQSMSLLSGGEKALTAISILFAILSINPAPFCVLDEIEAALDDVNVNRFSNYILKFSNTTQFLLITHRKGTMQIANNVYGITMEEKGISKLLSLQLD